METLIPKVWRYLLWSFFKIFGLTCISLCMILFVARFQDIARFSAMVGSPILTGKYILLQIPYLLPFAMVLASFFSCYFIGSTISASHELTAIRTAGTSLFALFTPLRYALFSIAICCSLFSFAYHPYSKARIAQLISEVNTRNPFLLLKNAKLHSNKRMHIAFEDSATQDGISNVICGLYNEKTEKLDLFLSKKVEIDDKELHAENASFISMKNDGVLIEDIQQMKMHLQTFSEWVEKNTKLLSSDCIPFTTLFYRFLENPKKEQTFFFAIGQAIFFPLTIFFLSQIALYASYSIGRQKNRKQTFFLLSAFFFTFTCYAIGKSLETKPLPSFFAFIVPFLFLPFIIRQLRTRVESGVF